MSLADCAAVKPGFWAPTGSAGPIDCPPSGFYCPGAVADKQFGGARPLLLATGQRTNAVAKEVLRQEMTLDMSLEDYKYAVDDVQGRAAGPSPLRCLL